METKTCFKCGMDLPRSEFYKHARMADGLLSKCKECTRVDVQRNRLLHIDKYREYDRVRSKTGARKQMFIDKTKRRRAESKLFDKAHNATTRAVKAGKLIRPDHCTKCMIPCVPQAHHDDYNKPLDVLWLCPICHAQRHVELGRVRKITHITETP